MDIRTSTDKTLNKKLSKSNQTSTMAQLDGINYQPTLLENVDFSSGRGNFLTPALEQRNKEQCNEVLFFLSITKLSFLEKWRLQRGHESFQTTALSKCTAMARGHGPTLEKMEWICCTCLFITVLV